MSELITMDREYVTRDGREVRLLTTCSPIDGFPVVGFYKTHGGNWGIGTWDDKGCYRSCGLMGHECDLLPKPKRHKRTVYINVYQDNGDYYLHSSRKSADVSSVTRCGVVRSDKRIACLELNLDFAEGEGLEP